MQRGNWVPMDKGLVSTLPYPGSREYSEVEAAFCVTCDFDNGNLASQNGYATLWLWSRGRVGRFAKKRGWSISKETPRGINKLEIDREKTGCVIHDPSWNRRTTGDTTGDTTDGQPTDNGRATGGQPDISKNSNLKGVADNRRTTDGQPVIQPTDNRRTTGDTLLYNLDPNPDPKTTTASCSGEENKNKESGQAGEVDTSRGDNHEPGTGSSGKENRFSSKKENKVAVRPDWMPEELWKELITNRSKKKLANTPLAVATLCNAIKKGIDAGYSVEECVGEFVQSRWTRFNHEWIRGDSSHKNGNSQTPAVVHKPYGVTFDPKEYMRSQDELFKKQQKENHEED